jgi:uncharacterized HAD superfamily protein
VVIILDLDGTLCDNRHRVELAVAGRWDEFNSLCGLDIPYDDVMAFIAFIPGNIEVVAVTGRDERWRSITVKWLQHYEICIDALLMRATGDYSPDAEVKLKLIEQHFGSKENAIREILFAIDDRDRVVEAYRNYGLNCWQVRQGDY